MIGIESGINYRRALILSKVATVAFAERLAETREKRGFTQPGFAAELTERLKPFSEPKGKSKRQKYNITQQQISIWETGVNWPNSLVLRYMAEILNVTTDYLLGIVDDENSRLEEADLTPEEKALVRAVRRNPSEAPMVYRAFGIRPLPKLIAPPKRKR